MMRIKVLSQTNNESYDKFQARVNKELEHMDTQGCIVTDIDVGFDNDGDLTLVVSYSLILHPALEEDIRSASDWAREEIKGAKPRKPKNPEEAKDNEAEAGAEGTTRYDGQMPGVKEEEWHDEPEV